MNNYRNFRVQDFVWDESFRQWVLHPTRENDRMWSGWLSENDNIAPAAKEAREIVLSMFVEEPSISDHEIRRNVKMVIGRLTLTPSEVRTEKRHRSIWLRLTVLIVLIGVLGWFGGKAVLKNKSISDETKLVLSDGIGDELAEVFNHKPVAQIVSPGDGSTITLKPGGSLKYKSNFVDGEKREVYLTGEAFFDVAKNPEQPFFVYAGKLVTKVLGTSFSVDAREESGNVVVAVATGKVSVFISPGLSVREDSTAKEPDGIILTPNQKITFLRDQLRLVKSIVDVPEVLMPKTQVVGFDFVKTPVSEVFATLAKAYGIEIIYDEELYGDCLFTSRLDIENLHEKLTVICQSVNATYEILDGQIVIHGKGCKN